jgi:FkbM family methyltransferase
VRYQATEAAMNIRGREITLIDELPSTRFVIDNIDTWEQDTFDTIDKYVQGGTFVDIGAWCGIFSLYASHVADYVFAFEPDPVAFDLLERNIEANGITNINALNFAAWDYDGSVKLRAHPEGLGSSMTGPSRDGDPIHVICVSPETLRIIVETPVVDLIKVDTEGSETHILPGLLDWDVPIHLSLHLDEMDGPIGFGDRKVEWLVKHSAYPVVLLT